MVHVSMGRTPLHLLHQTSYELSWLLFSCWHLYSRSVVPGAHHTMCFALLCASPDAQHLPVCMFSSAFPHMPQTANTPQWCRGCMCAGLASATWALHQAVVGCWGVGCT